MARRNRPLVKRRAIRVPDIPGPTAPLCWKQSRLMVRCDRRKGHKGRHSWEPDLDLHALCAAVRKALLIELKKWEPIDG